MLSRFLEYVWVALAVTVLYIAIGLDYCVFGIEYFWHRIIRRQRVMITHGKFSPTLWVLK